MTRYFSVLAVAMTAVGAILGIFLGQINGLFIALICFVVVDYVTGLISAIVNKKLSSAVGFKGILKKVVIFLVVGVANLLDVYVLGDNAVLRSAVIFFYIANEGISILENAGELGLPIPHKLKDILAQLRERDEKDGENDE